ncbi:uncharacterized protein VTP21DRAFT_10876 [Calcarisporiella thermophila]|uniref:uncharacterized protein n=1 Tax=Calcarisporiella thermophila TaxID=911321 RepID=UPI0037427BFE
MYSSYGRHQYQQQQQQSIHQTYSHSHRSYPYRPTTASPPPLQHPVPTHPFHVRDAPTPPPAPRHSSHAQPYYSMYGDQSQFSGRQLHQQHGMDFNQMLGIDDATARLGVQFGKSAVMAGHEYMEKNLNRYVNISTLKYYFNVTNTYVLGKIKLLVFPWRHKPWARAIKRSENTGQIEGYRPPREDINSPDLYIPAMAFVTYVLLVGLIQGRARRFHPELLGLTASSAMATMIFEMVVIKLGCYLLNISTDIQLFDLLAYSGYKFVGVIITLLVKLVLPSWMAWATYLYTALAIGFFLVELRSLRYMVLPDSSTTTTTAANAPPLRKRRVYFLFLISSLQLVFMFLLI